MKRHYKLKRNYEPLGDYLRKSRERAGLTQREVSIELGYSTAQFISNFECGISHPPISKLKEIIKICGLNQGTVTRLLLAGDERKIIEALQG